MLSRCVYVRAWWPRMCVCASLKATGDGLHIYIGSCSIIPPLSSFILSHVPLFCPLCKSGLIKVFSVYLIYLWNYPPKCYRITSLLLFQCAMPLSTCAVAYHMQAHIRLAPQTSDLFIRSLTFTPRSNAGADSCQVNLRWAYTIGCLFTILLGA